MYSLPVGGAGAFLYLCLKLPFQHLRGSPVKVLGASEGQDSCEARVGSSPVELGAGTRQKHLGDLGQVSCLQASEPGTRTWPPFPEGLSTVLGAGESLTFLFSGWRRAWW